MAIAFCASAPEPISTKPKPLLRPVSRSVMITTEVTFPAWENSSRNSSSVAV